MKRVAFLFSCTAILGSTIYAISQTIGGNTADVIGSGSVTNVSIVTANGVSGTVANPSTTPALTFTLGAITPTTVNGVTIPTTSDTVALLGTAQTFTAANNFSAAGSLSVPTLAFGNCGTNCGILAPAAGQLQFTVAGAAALDYGITNAGSWSFAGVIQTASASHFAIRLTNNTGAIALRGGNTFLGSPANASLQLGDADSATPVAQTLRFQSGATLNTAGVNDTVVASLSSGSGNSGNLIFQTGVKSGVSGTPATATTALTIAGENQAIITSGTLTVGSLASASGLFVCETAGLLSSGVTTCVASDRAVKHDIVPIDDDLVETVLAKRGVRFTYNKGKGVPGRRIGVIANDWENDFPELVDFDTQGIRHFDYAATWGLSVEMFRQQQKTIDDLKKLNVAAVMRTAEQQEEINLLKASIATIQSAINMR